MPRTGTLLTVDPLLEGPRPELHIYPQNEQMYEEGTRIKTYRFLS